MENSGTKSAPNSVLDKRPVYKISRPTSVIALQVVKFSYAGPAGCGRLGYVAFVVVELIDRKIFSIHFNGHYL